MKVLSLIFVAIIALLMVSCNGSKNQGELTFKHVTLIKSYKDCDPEKEGCTYVSFDYPEVTGASSVEVKDAVNALLKSLLFDDSSIGDANVYMQAFIDDYNDVVEEVGTSASWFEEHVAEVVYEAPDIVVFTVLTESYTGGAHGLSEMDYLNIDPKTGLELILSDILNKGAEEDLVDMAELKFRKHYNMKDDAKFSDEGFWFDDEKFMLSDNFAITTEGLAFHYNSYEIAPYSMGVTNIILQWADVNDLVKQKYIPGSKAE